jgi:adenylate cyclase
MSSAITSEKAELLLDVSRQVAAHDSLDEILETLVAVLSEQVGAERSTVFLNDERSGELYSRMAQGNVTRRIRMLNTSGLAGDVFTRGESTIVTDAYADERFNRDVDVQTGFKTESVLCVPIRTVGDDVIGVVQVLNKIDGQFHADDLQLVEAITQQAAVALVSAATIERMQKSRAQEMEFLDMVADITSEIDLRSLLGKVIGETTRMLSAERSTLFLNDDKTGELFALIGEGLAQEIRFPNHLGIAGAVFVSGDSVNIPYAYADMRFNPTVDRQTGFFTRSILCTPVVTKAGRTIGVTQVLNKRGGPFTSEDEQRLRAFTAQISIALENAKLFADVQNMKNYNESMLESMSNGVVTLDEDGVVVTCNNASQSIMGVTLDDIISKQADMCFVDENAWVMDRINRVAETGETEFALDAEMVFGEETKWVNLTVQPLLNEEESLGTLLMIEDISTEKRMKSTMSRYMDPGLADQLLAGGEDILGGRSLEATVLFSDIRGFTPLTESLGPQGTVALLNDYFTLMVDCISQEGGMLDKFIGDAIMAGFGIPVSGDDDEDRAMRAGIDMHRVLDTWNAERSGLGQLPVNMGVGLNTDEVVSGNIGSPKRMDYTMIGDGVNLAARLEGLCKYYFARMLIAESTYKRLKGTYRCRDIDHVVVKGKSEAALIYEVLDYHTDESFPNLMDVVGHFTEGRRIYREGNFAKANTWFQKALAGNPADKPSQMYIDRCKHLIEEPPKDWDGVWVMKGK